ncbi:hypothetical protein [Nocardia rhizosphaerae]|uniref:Uncharacterized protein n=1 Tax=Nocardia rhizosphaerae TaxID=1691571 RepID=A0ABV8LDK8_9NOCA
MTGSATACGHTALARTLGAALIISGNALFNVGGRILVLPAAVCVGLGVGASLGGVPVVGDRAAHGGHLRPVEECRPWTWRSVW